MQARRLWLLRACALVLLLGTSGVSCAGELRPYEASYRGIWHGMTVAVSDLTLEQTGDTWTYRSSSSPRGLGRLAAGVFPPRQVSVVRITPTGVQPLSFKSEGGESSKSVALTYDWAAQRVTGTYEGTAVDLPLTPDVRDDASVQLALTVELLAGRTPRSFRVIDKNSTRQYEFARDGTATLATPLGAIATVVYRSQKAGSPRITRFWCAPERGYIPVKVEQTRGDEVQWTLEIESLRRP
ncbi:MAG TPA: DUF3108 domain-containing protein [Steroidobacteraceae bacterium]|nr:DUF3108 domain-containing protein [Gammaproteobacteria bacterium]HEV2286640.1 DUF3108 domain-containing protein [Steroidobacteraceae bacterium]